MERGHDLSAFADSGGDTLDRAGANVPDGEYTGTVRFQRMATLLASGSDEAIRVQRHIASGEPVRVRVGADEQKQMVDRARRFIAARAVAPAYAFEIALVAFERGD